MRFLVIFWAWSSPIWAVEFTPYGCEQYALWAGEVGKARDELRHPSQMVQMIEWARPDTKLGNDIADFLVVDIDRIYSHPLGSEETERAREECHGREGDTKGMWR